MEKQVEGRGLKAEGWKSVKGFRYSLSLLPSTFSLIIS
jgi:hypothetical protein